MKIHPGSVVGKTVSLKTDWLVYEEMTRVGRTAYVRGVTAVSPAAVALIGGPSKLGREGEGAGGNLYTEESSDSEVEAGEAASTTNTTVMVDTWITFLARQEVATQVMQLRQKWFSLWMRRLTTTSKQARMQEEQDNAVFYSMAALLAQEEAGLGLTQT